MRPRALGPRVVAGAVAVGCGAVFAGLLFAGGVVFAAAFAWEGFCTFVEDL